MNSKIVPSSDRANLEEIFRTRKIRNTTQKRTQHAQMANDDCEKVNHTHSHTRKATKISMRILLLSKQRLHSKN